jgi:hypothetical protein
MYNQNNSFRNQVMKFEGGELTLKDIYMILLAREALINISAKPRRLSAMFCAGFNCVFISWPFSRNSLCLMLDLLVLLGHCNFSTFGRVVVVFVTIVTPHFGLLLLLSTIYTYTTGKGSVIIYCQVCSWYICVSNLV